MLLLLLRQPRKLLTGVCHWLTHSTRTNLYSGSCFNTVLGFARPQLLISKVQQFLQDVMIAWLVLRRAKMTSLLPGRTDLGHYTDIILLEAGPDNVVQPFIATRYILSDPITRPFGFTLGGQCPKCNCLTKLFLKKADEELIIIHCPVCPAKIRFNRPAGYQWVFDWHQTRKGPEAKKQKKAAKKGREREVKEGSSALEPGRMWLSAPFNTPSSNHHDPLKDVLQWHTC
jgi:hypothetical protein